MAFLDRGFAPKTPAVTRRGPKPGSVPAGRAVHGLERALPSSEFRGRGSVLERLVEISQGDGEVGQTGVEIPVERRLMVGSGRWSGVFSFYPLNVLAKATYGLFE